MKKCSYSIIFSPCAEYKNIKNYYNSVRGNSNITSSKNINSILSNIAKRNHLISTKRLNQISNDIASPETKVKSPFKALYNLSKGDREYKSHNKLKVVKGDISKKKNSSIRLINQQNRSQKGIDTNKIESKYKSVNDQERTNTISNKSQSNSKPEIFSNFMNYAKFYTYNKGDKKENLSITLPYNNKSIEKNIDFSKIHEKLTSRITEIKISDSSIEVIKSMHETYFNTLSEICHNSENEITSIIKVIVSGLKTTFESMCKKIDYNETTNQSIKADIKNLNCNIEKLKGSLDKQIKINNELTEEIGKLKEENKELKKSSLIIKETISQSVQTVEKFENNPDIKNIHKKRENKLIYFFNLLEEKGFPVHEIYDEEIKSISTDRFTSLSEQSKSKSIILGGEENSHQIEDSTKGKKQISIKNSSAKENCTDNKLDFIPILNISEISLDLSPKVEKNPSIEK